MLTPRVRSEEGMSVLRGNLQLRAVLQRKMFEITTLILPDSEKE